MDTTAVLDEELSPITPKEKKPSVLLTVLAGLCAVLASAVVMLGDCMLFGTVSVVFFAAPPLLCWLFAKLFRGRLGGALLTVSAVSAALALYLGTAINAGGVFAMAEGWPPAMVPYVAYLMLADSWMIVTLYTHILYYLIFSLLGFFVVLICSAPGRKVHPAPAVTSPVSEEPEMNVGDEPAEDNGAADESMDDAAAAAEAEAAVAAESEAQAAAEVSAEASLTAAIEAETAAEAAAAEVVSDSSVF